MSAKTILALDTKTGDQATVYTPPEHLQWLAVDFIKERLADPYRCSGGPQDRVFLDYLLALVESLTAERDALAAQVARVEEVLDHWRTVDEGNAAYAERIGERSRFADGLASRADMLRAALADPEADTSDTQPTDQEVSDE
jgi:hypothetical protein